MSRRRIPLAAQGSTHAEYNTMTQGNISKHGRAALRPTCQAFATQLRGIVCNAAGEQVRHACMLGVWTNISRSVDSTYRTFTRHVQAAEWHLRDRCLRSIPKCLVARQHHNRKCAITWRCVVTVDLVVVGVVQNAVDDIIVAALATIAVVPCQRPDDSLHVR